MDLDKIVKSLELLGSIPGYDMPKQLKTTSTLLGAISKKRKQEDDPFEYPSGYIPYTEKWYYPLMPKDTKKAFRTLEDFQEDRTYEDQLAKTVWNREGDFRQKGLDPELQKNIWGKTADFAQKAGGKTANFLFNDVLMAFPRAGAVFSAKSTDVMNPDRREGESAWDFAKRKQSSGDIDYSERFKRLPESLLSGGWEALKALPNLNKDYKDWGYTQYAQHIGIPDKKFSWAEDTDDWVRGTNWMQKISDAVAGNPASVAGFAGDVLLDPLTYLGFGVAKGAKGINVGRGLLKKLGLSKNAIKTGKAFLTKSGTSRLTSLYDDALKMLKTKPAYQKIARGKGMKALRNVQGLTDDMAQALPKEQVGGKAFGESAEQFAKRLGANKQVARQFAGNWQQKTAKKIAEKQLGKEVGEAVTKGVRSKLIDHGGIKVMQHTLIRPEFFDKVGLSKLSKAMSPHWSKSIGSKVTRGWRKVMTSRGNAPEELADAFFYHFDLMTANQRRSAADDVIKLFEKSGKGSRKKMTEFLSKPWMLDNAPHETLSRSPLRKAVSNEYIKYAKKTFGDSPDFARLNKINDFIDDVSDNLMTKVRSSSGFKGHDILTESPWATLQNEILKMGGLRTDYGKFINHAWAREATERMGRATGYLDDFMKKGTPKTAGKGGVGVVDVFTRLKADDGFAKLLADFNIKNPQDLLKKLMFTSSSARKNFDDMYRLTSRSFFSSEETGFEQAVSWLIKNDSDFVKTFSKLEKLEEVRTIAMARIARDPVGKVTGGLRSYIMNLTPENVEYYIRKIGAEGVDPKNVGKKISNEIADYTRKISTVKKRIKKGLDLTPKEMKLGQEVRKILDDLHRLEQAYGVESPYRKGYLPTYLKDWKKMKRGEKQVVKKIGSATKKFQKGKKYVNPIEAKRAGIPIDDDIASIIYKRHNDSIVAIQRKQFLEKARKLGVDPNAKFIKSKGKKPLASIHKAEDFTPKEQNMFDRWMRRYKTKDRKLLKLVKNDDYYGRMESYYSYDPDLVQDILSKHNIDEGVESFLRRSDTEIFKAGTPEKKAIDDLFEPIRKMIDDVGDKKLVQIDDVPELKGMWFEKDAADMLTKTSEFLTNETSAQVIKVWDGVTNWWKAFATSANPGFHFRNAYSNWWQLHLKDGPQGLNLARHKMATDMLLGKEGKIKVGKKVFSYDEVMGMAHKTGTVNRGWLGADIPTAVSREIDDALSSTVQKVRKKAKIFSTEGAIVEGGTKFGKFVENEARLTGFLNDFIASGGDAWWAARRTKMFLFDYSALSKLEKSLFKRLIPFYTWTRKNMPLEFTQLLQQPGKFGAIPKVKRLIESNADIPESYTEHDNDLFDNLYGFATPFKDSKGNMLVLNPNFAWQDLIKVAPDDYFSMLNPMISLPFELGFNYSVFYGREIENYDGEKVPAPSYLAGLKYLPYDVLKKLGLSLGKGRDAMKGDEPVLYMPAKAEYLSRQMPFLYNLSKSMPQEETDYTPFTRAGWLSGVKFIPYRETSAHYFRTEDKLAELDELEEKYIEEGKMTDPLAKGYRESDIDDVIGWVKKLKTEYNKVQKGPEELSPTAKKLNKIIDKYEKSLEGK